jgi:hypothetical protein
VIATGFERTISRRQVLQQQYGRTVSPPTHRPQTEASSASHQVPAREREEREMEPVQPKFAPNNLEIPAFLRRR